MRRCGDSSHATSTSPSWGGRFTSGPSTADLLARMALHARWARFADGADEVHQWRIAQRTIDAYKRDKSTRMATGDLPL